MIASDRAFGAPAAAGAAYQDSSLLCRSREA